MRSLQARAWRQGLKRHYGLMGLLTALFFLSGVLWARPSNADPITQTVPNEYLVTFVPGTRAAQREATVQGLGGHIVDRIGQLNVDLVRFPTERPSSLQSAGDVVDVLAHHPLVEYIQPNYVYSVSDVGPRKSYLPYTIGPTHFVPNDPSLPFQYAWSKLDAYKGWLYDSGSENVIVAVVDTGVQLNHPDLQNKLMPGYDFVDDDDVPDDTLNGHGTHVAGIVGATTNNGTGVAGTCPRCKLLPVRVLNAGGGGTTDDVAEGIVYAVDRGAKVINLSLSGEFDDETLAQAVKYAWNKGAFVACAAGNAGDKNNVVNYPAYYDACEAIGATNKDDSHALFSQWGQWIDLVAPGSGIYSTHLYYSDDPASGYATFSGTSMATPFVSGVAGLLAGQGLTNQQIRDRLRQSAEPIAGTGTYWSNGRLNMWRAVQPR